jgi:type VI secretion system protein ImpF
MPSGDVERSVQLSLLDRLLNSQSDSRHNAPISRSESLRLLRQSVKTNLEWILNASRTVEPIPESYKEVQSSLYVYGLPDINSVTLDNAQDEARLVRSLESAIVIFEPRLTRVRVSTYERLSKKKTSLVFHVEATLMSEPEPERIFFDTVLEIAKGAYTVKDDQSA